MAEEKTSVDTDTRSVAGSLKRSLDFAQGMGRAVSKGARRLADKVGQSKREAEDEMKRETRGMKKGGMVSASKRADGCAVKGKTKGKMV